MAQSTKHLSLTDDERLTLLNALTDDDFRERMMNDPIAALAEHDITLTEADLREIVRERIIVPPAADVRENLQKYKDEIPGTGLIFGRSSVFFCIIGDGDA